MRYDMCVCVCVYIYIYIYVIRRLKVNVSGTAKGGRDCHYRIKILPYRETTPCQTNVAHPALVDKTKFYMPPVHTKLSSIKMCVKVMDIESEGLSYLRQQFPRMLEAKIKIGIFIGPQIKQRLKDDQDFTAKLNSTERRA